MGTITFPNLGISLNPSRVAFSLFGKDVYWYGIIIAFGFIFYVIVKICKREIRQIHPILWVSTALFVLNFILLATL